MRARLVVALSVAVGFALSSSRIAVAEPKVSRLENGLTLVLEEDHRSPRVGLVVTYAVGAEDDPAGKRGRAAVMAKLLGAPSTRHVGRKDYPLLWDALGVTPLYPTIDVRMDRTFLTHALASNQLELALWLESDRMGFLLDGVDAGTLAAAGRLVEEDRQREEIATAYGGVQAIIRHALFPEGHPYNEWILGRGAETASLSVGEVRDAYKRLYAPSSATIVLVGDFDEAQTRAWVSKYFGPIPAAPAPPSPTVAARPALVGEKHITVEANVPTERIVLVWSTPPYQEPGDAELDLFAQLAANVPAAPLQATLLQSGLATRVDAYQRSNRLASRFEVEVDLRDGVDGDRIPKLLDDLFSNMTFSDDDLKSARARMLREAGFGQETFRGRARALAMDMFYGKGDPTFGKKNRARYHAVTPESIAKTVKAQLVGKGRLFVHVVRSGDAPAAGRARGTSL